MVSGHEPLHRTILPLLFTALRKRGIRYGKSVRPSCQNEGMQRDAVFTIEYPSVSSFLTPRMVDGGRPCPGKS